jgi:ferritin-like metal-binding protein YciE
METGSMRYLLEEQLKDLYSMEIQMLRALPDLKDRTSSESLYHTLDRHFEETNFQLKRLDEIACILGIELPGRISHVLEAILDEAEHMLDLGAPPTVMDVSVVSIAQRMKHLEIAAYRSASALADHLGLNRVYNILLEILSEEYATNDALTDIRKLELFPKNEWESTAAQDDYPSPDPESFYAEGGLADDFASDKY